MSVHNRHSLRDLDDLVNMRDPVQVRDASKDLVESVFPSTDFSHIDEVYSDVLEMFAGTFSGFQENNNPYHDLSHSLGTYMTGLRLLHGLQVARKEEIPPPVVVSTAALLLLHDEGMLPRNTDTGLGAEHTIGHEDQGKDFFKMYKKPRSFLTVSDNTIDSTFDSTNLRIPPKDVNYTTDVGKVMGRIVGTADLLAQVSDKRYLEKLPGLFREFEAAGIAEGTYDTAEDLMRKTPGFYDMIKTRLIDLGKAYRFAHLHFREKYGIDRNLYTEAMDQNISYLQEVIAKDGFDTMLRRQ
jgi:hypothetical protein